jgi:hypothetical protein
VREREAWRHGSWSHKFQMYHHVQRQSLGAEIFFGCPSSLWVAILLCMSLSCIIKLGMTYEILCSSHVFWACCGTVYKHMYQPSTHYLPSSHQVSNLPTYLNN